MILNWLDNSIQIISVNGLKMFGKERRKWSRVLDLICLVPLSITWEKKWTVNLKISSDKITDTKSRLVITLKDEN